MLDEQVRHVVLERVQDLPQREDVALHLHVRAHLPVVAVILGHRRLHGDEAPASTSARTASCASAADRAAAPVLRKNRRVSLPRIASSSFATTGRVLAM